MGQASIASPAGEQDYSLSGLAIAMLRNRQWFVLLPVAVAGLLVVGGLLKSRTYSTTIMFAPQTGTAPIAGLEGIAAEFGVDVGSAGGGLAVSPDFYVMLLGSDGFLRELARTRYTVEGDDGPVTGEYAEIAGLGPSGEAEALAAAVVQLRTQVSARVDVRSRIVLVTVQTRQAGLTMQMGRRVLALVDSFNLETRQTKAGREFAFVDARLGEATRELAESEQVMLQFLQRNRDFRNSPTLVFEHDRYQRDLERLQGIVNQLAHSREAARIELVRNTPVTTLVQPPLEPLHADPRRLRVRGLLGLVLGFALAFGVTVVRGGLTSAEGGRGEDLAEIRRLLAEFADEAQHPIRTLRRWLPGTDGRGG